MQRDRTGATQENSREATPTGLQQKDVIPVRSGLLPPLLRGQQPGMIGEETKKRQREGPGATAENSRKTPRLEQEKIFAVEDDVDLSGSQGYELPISEVNYVKGMPNLGYTCYFNALVQCLLALGKLRTEILRPNAKLGVMGRALKDLFMKTNSPGYPGELMDPALLTACVRAFDPSFKDQGMHDSQELFLAFLRRLGEEEEEEELSKPPHTQEGISGSAMLEFIFGGGMCIRSSCTCSRSTEKSVPFNNLELTLSADHLDVCQIESNHLAVDQIQSNNFHSPTSVEDCLKQYFEAKKLEWCCSSTSRSTDGDQTSTKVAIASEELNSLAADTASSSRLLQELGSGTSCLKMVPVSCSSCNSWIALDKQNDSTGRVEEQKVNDGAVQRSSISKLPHVLTLLMGRYGVRLGGKNTVLSSTIKLSGHISFQEILDMEKFMDPSYEVKNCTYHLAGVIEHIGKSLNEGHYVSYVKGKANADDQIRRWFCVGDKHVKEVSLEEVQKCEAYMMFYERGGD